MTDAPSLTMSAVLATRGRGERLEPVLSGLLDQGSLDEVIVVLDGTEDASLEVATELASRDARLRPLWVTHRGQFRALHAGIESARTDIVWILDDDVTPSPGTAAGHLAHHGAESGLVVLGYMPVRSDLGRREVVSAIYAREYESRCRAHESDPASVLEHLWGGNISFRRDDYLRLDPTRLLAPAGLDDARLYHEDRELGLRFSAAGLHGRFDRSLHAVHDHHRDAAGFLRDAFGRGVCDVVIDHLHPDPSSPAVPPGRLAVALGGLLVGRPLLRTRMLGALAWTVDLATRSGAVRFAGFTARAHRRLVYVLGSSAAHVALGHVRGEAHPREAGRPRGPTSETGRA